MISTARLYYSRDSDPLFPTFAVMGPTMVQIPVVAQTRFHREPGQGLVSARLHLYLV